MNHLAPFACHHAQTRGRLHPEPESEMRSPFQRDRDRILHSTAFRRLEYKTQVFVNHEGDHYRTRLTHSLEVSQIARSLCRNLMLDEDVGETIALAHDLGHTPFGHAGEDGLSEAMQAFGGFSHNDHTLRIVTALEKRYAEFDGLNLTWETLEGLAKHNGPVDNGKAFLAPEYATGGDFNLELASYASAEAQVAALADDIAYHNHDIDDGLRAGLFSIEELAAIPEIYEKFAEVKQAYPDITAQRQTHEAIRRLIHMMCRDVYSQTMANIETHAVQSVADVRQLGLPLVAFSEQMDDINLRLKAFLMQRMYKHHKVNRMSSKARRVMKELFAFFLAEPECLPEEWRGAAMQPGTAETARVVADYLAGMTDRYAFSVYRQIFNVE